jgi:hypothetical protein
MESSKFWHNFLQNNFKSLKVVNQTIGGSPLHQHVEDQVTTLISLPGIGETVCVCLIICLVVHSDATFAPDKKLSWRWRQRFLYLLLQHTNQKF